MATQSCKHGGYKMVEGRLVCANCGVPSSSKKWEANVYGRKAIEQGRTENKAIQTSENK